MVNDILLEYNEEDVYDIAKFYARSYGISPDAILEEIENKAETIRLLKTIIKPLTTLQAKILLMIGAGYTVSEMSETLNVNPSTITRTRDSIADRLLRVVSEKRIEFLKENLDKVGKRKRKKFTVELEQRLCTREAMKKLLVILTPPESNQTMDGKSSRPAYIFERLMNIGTGQKEAIVKGHRVFTNTSKCMLPEYFQEVFGDGKTYCTLCATCRRKKDNPVTKESV